ncbi:hypothetical protein L226DRAFT_524839 [Lentinus tigrinus ALCF2SS1-7]|uniref:uncharacterized protein n=1 Tax=Lentinus tigrinus ALCF2SS1-7 TaxID=1328758 RepID=UPI0011661656|nr:hypothetical protein L226DRAFT_524839 [Lentinus tigrinus ALCF2SS1-7]
MPGAVAPSLMHALLAVLLSQQRYSLSSSTPMQFAPHSGESNLSDPSSSSCHSLEPVDSLLTLLECLAARGGMAASLGSLRTKRSDGMELSGSEGSRRRAERPDTCATGPHPDLPADSTGIACPCHAHETNAGRIREEVWPPKKMRRRTVEGKPPAIRSESVRFLYSMTDELVTMWRLRMDGIAYIRWQGQT